ncbi:MAG: PSD1 domain-containing protein [Planctomycetia bacterium]|nr:PSD1 domain-containing protein [Planctomycetia bacterium]
MAARCVAADEIDFNRDIRPILSDKCFRCHGPDSGARQAELRLDREESAKADRDGNPAIVPGKPEASELVRRITADDEAERMPPKESHKELSPREIALLTRWVADGAVWLPHWAYIPPKRHPLPDVGDAHWPIHALDRFILSRLEAEGLAPSPDADRVTLARRLYIDLAGLPPRPEEVDAFLADDGPQAYERLVDRLLASPHFGERMAMYWLDLVRYADTVGYHGDQEHPISPYRDYVIEAFNENLRFDQFTREQLAGDLMPEPTLRQKIATGYNRVLQTSHEGGVQPKEYLAIYAADHVRNLSAVWLGATMGCSQCHDHKYDPYTTRDFYSMAAFFADVDEAQHLTKGVDKSPTIRAPEMELLTEEERARLAGLEARLKALEAPQQPAAAASSNDADAPKAASGSGARKETEPNSSAADPPKSESPPPSDKERKKEIAALRKQMDAIHNRARRTMITVSIEPRTMRILPRGNWLDESGPIVQPEVPAFLGHLDVGDRRATRLELARWLTDAEHGVGGLTARVLVNRLWYLFFGVGLSRSLDDFGAQGEPPVHPELLDTLAVELVESGWDVKRLVKLLVTSRAYRQASLDTPALHERDPSNRLVGRQSRFRYPAETVRDAALVTSGLLVDQTGGPSVKPYQPAGYYRHLNFPEREYQIDKDQRQWRRGVYVHWQRQYLHPMLKAFDAPSREECTAERPTSNTPLAALVLLNDPTFVEAARAFATRIIASGGATTDERLDFALRQAVSRTATTDERRVLGHLLDDSRKYYQDHPQAAAELVAVGLAPAPETADRGELAAWTILARTILSLNEPLTRK